MNKERIEKAAAEYRNDLLLDAALDVSHEYDKGMSDCIVEEIPKAFAAGAEWRISSVWHDASEKPENGRKALIWHTCIGGESDFIITSYGANVRSDIIIRWAYLDDLLPTEGGAE